MSTVAGVAAELPAGHPGCAVIRAILAEHAGLAPLGSGLEATVLRLLTAAGLAAPRPQVDLGGDGWIGRVDFYYPDARLVVEVDGAWWHDAPLDARQDERRTAALENAGFRVLRLSEDLIRRSPGDVVHRVRSALAAAA